MTDALEVASMPEDSAYFVRESETRFRPTPLVGGAWSTTEQHIAPALGLIAHCIERDRDARRDDDLRLTRLGCDILGVVPIEPFDITVEILRPGRTIELVEARLTHADRTIVLARAWLTQRVDTSTLAGSPLPAIPGPDGMVGGLGTLWPGGFVGSIEASRIEAEPGRAVTWISTASELVADEPVSSTASALALVDTANGTTPRVSPEVAVFPNLDTTVHLFRTPELGPVGYDTNVSFGPDGAGLTLTVLHDLDGPFGSSAQTLTVRPR